MNNLLKKKCIPCEKKGFKPFGVAETKKYMLEIPGWRLDKVAKKISKEFRFQDFIGAINFVNLVADIAEMEGHHPDIHVFYNKVRLDLFTHSVDGLTENDFILAAKIDAHI